MFHMFRSMVYFELNVAYGIRYGSWFIFSAYDYPVVLMPFVEKTVFFSTELPLHLWIYFCTFYFVLLIYFFIVTPIPHCLKGK